MNSDETPPGDRQNDAMDEQPPSHQASTPSQRTRPPAIPSWDTTLGLPEGELLIYDQDNIEA
jgi:hypothetical protein